jgi:hypothetical protein
LWAHGLGHLSTAMSVEGRKEVDTDVRLLSISHKNINIMTAKLSKEQFILAIKLISLSDLEIRI